jgi:hypothetical protein
MGLCILCDIPCIDRQRIFSCPCACYACNHSQPPAVKWGHRVSLSWAEGPHLQTDDLKSGTGRGRLPVSINPAGLYHCGAPHSTDSWRFPGLAGSLPADSWCVPGLAGSLPAGRFEGGCGALGSRANACTWVGRQRGKSRGVYAGG